MKLPGFLSSRPMRLPHALLKRTFVLAILLAMPTLARAQGMTGPGMNIGNLQSMPSLGNFAMPSGSIMGGNKQAAADVDPPLAVTDSYVSFIDSALPRNVVGLRFEATFNNRQPSRAEYYHPKTGVPGATGFPFVETRIDYQDLTSFVEYSWSPWFSIFMEAPYRWLNPEVNENRSGAGDLRYGLKLCTWSSDDIIASFLVRFYWPTARHDSLGTTHWSIEPGILASYRPLDKLLLEGEFRYWIPLTRDDFAGSLMRYGVGVSYGQRTPGVWYIPVAEGIGWTVLSGKTISANSPTDFVIEDANGQTIFNGYLGMRWGYGQHFDFYAGYGRSFTGHFWQREIYRFEMRVLY